MWKTMLASTVSGVLARLVCHPLDTCKARLQASCPTRNTVLYRNLWHVLRQTWMLEGLPGFYRGIGATIVGSAPANCLYLTSYEVSRDQLMAHSPLASYPVTCHLTAGLLAEAFSCILWVPIDVIKERLQIQQSYSGRCAHAGAYAYISMMCVSLLKLLLYF